jgi:hypothetical protein
MQLTLLLKALRADGIEMRQAAVIGAHSQTSVSYYIYYYDMRQAAVIGAHSSNVSLIRATYSLPDCP